jgi:hypothetical protein
VDDGEARHGGVGEQSCLREGRERGGKLADEVPHPKAELQQQLAATEER